MSLKPRLTSNRLQRTLLWLSLLGLPAVPTAAADDTPMFVDRIDVSVVNVEVFVTDRDGRPVPDLEAEDFEILVDGEAVEITNFFAFIRGEPTPAGDLDGNGQAAAPQEQEARSVAVRAETPLPEDQRLHLVVYVDHFNLSPTSRKRVLEDVRRFIDHRVSQGDQVMIAGYDGSLKVEQTFTRNILLLEQSLARMERVAAHRPRDESERRRVIRAMNIDSDRGVGGLRDAHAMVRAYVHSARHDLRRSVEALGTVARSLSGLPGRKALLYVSDGLPKRLGEELYQHLNDLFDVSQFREAGEGEDFPGGTFDPYLEALQQDETQLYKAITRHANAHQVTFYTLDARGAGGEGSLSAAWPGDIAGEGGRVTFEALRATNLQEPLIDLAETTGGASILNTNNFADALDDVAEAFDSFYSLGFQAVEEDEGIYRQIRVRVRRPDVQVRHRLGFMDKAPLDRVGDRTLSSLLLETTSNPLGVQVELGAPERRRRQYVLPVLVRIPMSEVTLLPQGDVYRGRLSIFVTVQDADGNVSELHHTPYPITIPADQMAEAVQREIGHGMNLRIAAGEPKIAIGVWDEVSGLEAFVHHRFAVGRR